ncbi:MAG TPA: cyanophycinase, partial [Mucilaginibacter sp.]
MKIYACLIAFICCSWYASAQSPMQNGSPTRHGPVNGTLIIIGGNVGSTASIWNKFTELAGGKDKAKIVVVTAGAGAAAKDDQKDVETVKKETGIKNVVLFHTSDLKEANSEKFIAPLKDATGVYFVGGRQWYIANSYLNTLTHQAFLDVLNRGGVIAGSSAGATIQGSFLWRGDTRGAQVLVGDHTQGLGFLKNSVIDQHVLKRNRQFDLIDLIKMSPNLIGFGLDEATAIVVHRDTLEVLGKSYVGVYDYDTIMGAGKRVTTGRETFATTTGPFFFLSEG